MAKVVCDFMKLEQNTSSGNGNEAYLFNADTAQEHIDAVVWRAFKTGDRKAFDYIFKKHVRLLYAYGGKITRDQNLVEDCIQDLFVELWQRRLSLADVNSIKFYLLKSLRRRISRRLSADKALIIEDAGVLEEKADVEFPLEFRIIEEQAAVEQREKLFHAISLLSKRQREAVYLKFYEKISYEQLADIMNLGLRSAYNIIGKAIETLRRNI